MKTYIAIISPLITAFAASHRFCMFVFSLSFVSRYFFFLISFGISLLIFQYHAIYYPCNHFCSFLFLWLISSFIPFWSEKMLEIISVFLNLLRLAFCPRIRSNLEKILCALEKKVYSVFSFFGLVS